MPYDGVFRWYLYGQKQEQVEAFIRSIEENFNFEDIVGTLQHRLEKLLLGTKLSLCKERLLQTCLFKEMLVYGRSFSYNRLKKSFDDELKKGASM